MLRDACVFCTPFSLKEGVGPDDVRGLVQEYMDDYKLDFEPGVDGKYCLDHVDAFEAGQSIVGRLGRLVDALGPLVADAFVLTLRNLDTGEDERDSEFFGGPDEQSILTLRQQRAFDEALETLRDVPGLDKQVAALCAAALCAPAAVALAIAEKPEKPTFDLTQGLARLNADGFDVNEDPDQDGKWYWWHAESATGSDISYDTQELACKAALACLECDQVTMMLHLEVSYKLNGHSPDAMKANLEQMVGSAIGDGMLTGSTAAEVNAHKFRVHQVTDLDEDELTEFISDRCENGAFSIEDLPRRLARYGMMPPGDFISEMDERMQEMEFGRYADGVDTSERPSP